MFSLAYLTIVTPMFFAGVITVLLAFYLWQRSNISEVKTFSVFLLLISLWSFGAAFEILSPGLMAKLFWARVEYIGISLVPPLWLIFCIQYTSKIKTRSYFFGLFIIPITTLALVWSSYWHQLFWLSSKIDVSLSPPTLVTERGFWFWYIHTPYSYILMMLALLFLLRKFLRSRHLFRSQMALLLSAAIIPLSVNVGFILGLNFVPNIDFTPLGFAISGLVVTYGLMRYRLLDLSPIAYKTIFESLPDAILILDRHYRILDANSAAQQSLGKDVKSLLGKFANDMIPNWQSLLSTYLEQENAYLEIPFETPMGTRVFGVRATPLFSSQNFLEGLVIMAQDVSERKEFQELAHKDTLTNLANRRQFFNHADFLLTRAKHNDQLAALLFLDLDNFKPINDSYGHDVGDLILKEVAQRLLKSIRKQDLLARLGGDEFAIFLTYESLEDVTDVCKRIIRNIAKPYALIGKPTQLDISIGITLFPQHGKTLELLLNRADKAMYKAKSAKAGYRFFDPEPTKNLEKKIIES